MKDPKHAGRMPSAVAQYSLIYVYPVYSDMSEYLG